MIPRRERILLTVAATLVGLAVVAFLFSVVIILLHGPDSLAYSLPVAPLALLAGLAVMPTRGAGASLH